MLYGSCGAHADRTVYMLIDMFEHSYVHVHVCMTLSVSPRDAVRWAAVRRTDPERRNNLVKTLEIISGRLDA